MKKLLLVLLLLPLFAYPQAVKRHRSIIIDSVKALNGGIIDIKDSASFEKPVGIGGILDASAILTLTDTTRGILIPRMTTAHRDAIGDLVEGLLIYNTDVNRFQYFAGMPGWGDVGVLTGDMLKSAYDTNNDSIVNKADTATFALESDTLSGDIDASQIVGLSTGDSSFVTLQVDTLKAFNNTNIQFTDSVFFQNPVHLNSSLIVNLAQTTLIGIDATSGDFGLKVQDNVGTELFNVRNDGNVGIGTASPASILDIRSGATEDQIRLGQDADNYYKIGRSASTGFLTFTGTQAGLIGYKFNAGYIFSVTGKGFAFDGDPSVGSFARTGDGSLVMTLHNSIAADFRFLLQHPASQFIIKAAPSQTDNIFEIRDSVNIVLVAVDSVGNVGIGTITPSKRLDVNGTVNISDTLFQNGVVIIRDCIVIADEASVNLPDATTQDLKVWVDGDDEWAIGAIQSDGTVTLPFVVGSVVNTDTDANLVIWNSAGSQVIIKNRLGSSKTVCYKTEYKQ